MRRPSSFFVPGPAEQPGIATPGARRRQGRGFEAGTPEPALRRERHPTPCTGPEPRKARRDPCDRCAAHGGGYLPSYAPRMDHSCFVSPANCDPNIKLKKKPTEYLNQLYFDSLIFTPEMLRHLIAQVGASQVVVGTDHPIPWQEKSVDHVLGTPGLSNAQKMAILGGTAAKLLGIKA